MLSSAFADSPFPRSHSRSAMKLSQIFRVHGIAPSRSRTKASHSPAPRQLLKHPPRRHPAFADGPFRADTHASPRVILNLPQARHTPPLRLVMPTTAGGVAFIGVPFPRPASPHLLQSAAFASSPPTSQAPFPSPHFRGQLFSAQTYAPRHGTPLKPPWPRQGIPSPHIRGRSPAPPRKKRAHGKARPPACGAIFPRPAAYCAFGVTSF